MKMYVKAYCDLCFLRQCSVGFIVRIYTSILLGLLQFQWNICRFRFPLKINEPYFMDFERMVFATESKFPFYYWEFSGPAHYGAEDSAQSCRIDLCSGLNCFQNCNYWYSLFKMSATHIVGKSVLTFMIHMFRRNGIYPILIYLHETCLIAHRTTVQSNSFTVWFSRIGQIN